MDPNKIRQRLGTELQTSVQHNGTSYTEIAEATEVPVEAVSRAVLYGVVDITDLILICRELGLCATTVLAEATNHEVADNRPGPQPCEAHGAKHGWHDITDPDTPIPTDRWLEIRISGKVDLFAVYLADSDRFMIGHDSVIERQDVTLWRVQPEGAPLAEPEEAKA